jgi:predicted dehydrogenase
MGLPLRVGIAGCGNVALNFHLPAYQEWPGRFQVVGVADPTPERLELGRTSAHLTAQQAHWDPRELIARDDIDVIDVCAPQQLHRDLVVAAAAAHKHVLCEKPVAIVPADAKIMTAAAEQSGVILAVVHNYLFFPEIVAARRVLEEGEIGEIRTVIINMLGVVDSPGAASYRPQWRHDPAASGGGVLMDMLHAVYLAECLLGSPFQRVSAYVDRAKDGDRVEGLALCRFESDQAAALVNVGWGLGPGGIDVSASRGRLGIRYRDDATFPWAPFEELTVTAGGTTRVLPLPPGLELVTHVRMSLRSTLADLADAIEENRPPTAGGDAAHRTLEATVAAYASAALGASVAVPLPANSPLHRLGVLGLRELDVPAWSPLRQRGLFGLGPASGGG